MQWTLKPEVEALLQRELSTGRFQDPDDLIETALHVLADSRPRDLTDLDAMIQEGLDDVDRGNVVAEQEARAHFAQTRAKLSNQRGIAEGTAQIPAPASVPGQTKRSLLNAAKGQILFADDWDSPETNKEIEDLFENSTIFPE